MPDAVASPVVEYDLNVVPGSSSANLNSKDSPSLNSSPSKYDVLRLVPAWSASYARIAKQVQVTVLSVVSLPEVPKTPCVVITQVGSVPPLVPAVVQRKNNPAVFSVPIPDVRLTISPKL